ncbi:unnamed protein product [Scytosiphon promiscuus]
MEQGYDLRDLAVCAQFFVDPASKVEREAGPLEVDAATGNDRATAAVAYPSIWDIWPEVHKMAQVRAVEVDMHVELRSRSGGEVVCSGPTFKVTYQRPATSTLSLLLLLLLLLRCRRRPPPPSQTRRMGASASSAARFSQTGWISWLNDCFYSPPRPASARGVGR